MDPRRLAPTRLALLLLVLGSCEGDRGPAGAPAPPTPPTPTATIYTRFEEAPELVCRIVALHGGSGGGSFAPGDLLRVDFALERPDGTPWDVTEMVEGLALVSGPTFAYQRVIAERSDVPLVAERLDEGLFSYRFPVPLPAAYLPPYNDTDAFGAGDGERTGQALLDGTYTVGLSFAWEYEVEGRTFRRVGEDTQDFPIGPGAGPLTPRQVTLEANCDRCHVDLQGHGGRHTELSLCLLCHTAGAEDSNDPVVAGGTPGVTIDSRVLFHRIHNGRHLPSVLGLAIDEDSLRDYTAEPRPYLVVDGEGALHDYSFVGLPVSPNRSSPMPKDFGYPSLTPEAQAIEDGIRTGVTTCFVCHGDPDGDGPLGAPPQGNLHFNQLTRAACGACHDDVVWEQDYPGATAQVMPPQLDDSQCIGCHDSRFGGPLATTDAHVHPLRNPVLDPGLVLDLQAVAEAASGDGDGRIEVGEGLQLFFALTEDDGDDVDPLELDGLLAVISGPTENANLVHTVEVPPRLVSVFGPGYRVTVPEALFLEVAGRSTLTGMELFTTSRAPHLDVPGAGTTVLAASPNGEGATLLASAVARRGNFVDVQDPTGFAAGDLVLVDDGAPGVEELLRITLVEGTRLWFSSPRDPESGPTLVRAHPAGVPVTELGAVPLVRGTHYDLDATAGTVRELAELGDGTVVAVSYTVEFHLPADYPAALNDSPDLGEAEGQWTGKALVDGTYRAGLLAHREIDASVVYEDRYLSASRGGVREFLVGQDPPVVPYGLIADVEACNACHQDLSYHEEAYRGLDACLLCHGNAGSEDLAPYAAAGAPPTPGVRTDFRSLLHRVHRGRDLAGAASFAVVGPGEGEAPAAFLVHGYETVLFPALPGRTSDCRKCHGDANTAWLEPLPRDHPTEPGPQVQVWRAVCLACHDTAAAVAHADAQTAPSGAESCVVCHGRGEHDDVEVVHRVR